jgi:hypothetical protein
LFFVFGAADANKNCLIIHIHKICSIIRTAERIYYDAASIRKLFAALQFSPPQFECRQSRGEITRARIMNPTLVLLCLRALFKEEGGDLCKVTWSTTDCLCIEDKTP